MSLFATPGAARIATILVAGCSPAVAAAASLSCALSSGQRLVTTRDLSALFPGAVASCQDAGSAAPPAPPLTSKMPRLVWSAAGLAGGGRAVAMDALDAAPSADRDATNDDMAPRRLAARVPPEGVSVLIADAAGRHGVDPHLVRAIVQVESAFRPAAVSNKGAVGLMQIMPATGARYGVSQRNHLLDPATNIDAGTRYLRDLMAMFPGRKDLVIAAYNAGEGAVLKYGRAIPPYQETRSYVRMVMQVYESIVGSKAGAALNALRGVSPDANQVVR